MNDSPIKKVNLESVGKENITSDVTPIEVDPLKKVSLEVKEVPKTKAELIKEAEANEPLLQENPNRFVLFPLKYHEVYNPKILLLPKLIYA